MREFFQVVSLEQALGYRDRFAVAGAESVDLGAAEGRVLAADVVADADAVAAAANPGSGSKRGKPVPSRRSQLVAKIRDAEGPVEITEAVDRFLAEFPDLPRDYEVLEKALHHRKGEVVRKALEQIEANLAQAKPRRNRSLLMKLALLAENHDDEDICALAARIRPLL